MIKKNMILKKTGDVQYLLSIETSLKNIAVELSSTAAYIWEALDSNILFSELCKMYANDFSISLTKAEEDVKTFIDYSLKYNLLVIEGDFFDDK